MEFRDKVVLVTGGSDGLGRGIAAAFAERGAKVVVNGRNQVKLDRCVKALRALGGNVMGIAADIADSAAVTAMFKQIVATHGTLDVLINNAAMTPSDAESTKARLGFMQLATTPIPKRSLQVTSQMSDERWLSMVNTNINGMFYCTRAALQIMEPQGYGRIVNIGSIAGISGLSAHSPHYSATKGAMVAFTKSVAVEVAGAGITVNCVAAGGVATEAWTTMATQAGEAFTRQLMQMIPMGRMGSIQEFASLAMYLASDDSAYLTGQTISPNGGMLA